MGQALAKCLSNAPCHHKMDGRVRVDFPALVVFCGEVSHTTKEHILTRSVCDDVEPTFMCRLQILIPVTPEVFYSYNL